MSRGFLTRESLKDALATAAPGSYSRDDSALNRELDDEFSMWDANGDGVVTWEEFRNAMVSQGSSPIPPTLSEPLTALGPGILLLPQSRSEPVPSRHQRVVTPPVPAHWASWQLDGCAPQLQPALSKVYTP